MIPVAAISLAAILVLLVGITVPLAASQEIQEPPKPKVDALGSEPRPGAPWRIGAFAGAAHNSPVTSRLGITPGRDHFFLGLQAQTTVLKMGATRVSYGVQVLPAVVIRGRTVPANYYGPTDEEGLLPGSNTAYAFGLSPFVIELAVPVAGRFAVFGATAGGMLIFTRPFPVPDAKQANFTIEYGGGALVRVGQKQWLVAGYKHHHLSNAYHALSNPGLDGNVIYLGFWKGLGK